jgi:predicted nucleotidyltransferase
MTQPEQSSSSSGIRFLDRQKLLAQLRQAARNLRRERDSVEQIILFGSLARDDYYGGSDADIAIILTASALPPAERSRELFHYFWPISAPVDLLIFTREEINQAITGGDYFIKNIIEHGLRL